MCSVANKYKAIITELEKKYKSNDQIKAWLARELGETVKGKQASIMDYSAKKKAKKTADTKSVCDLTDD